MVIFVIITNLTISAINFYLAWRIWQLQAVLVKFNQEFPFWEQRIYYTLNSAPEVILQGKTVIDNLGQKYQKLIKFLDILQKCLVLWRWGRRIQMPK